jgi:hypothetical protein
MAQSKKFTLTSRSFKAGKPIPAAFTAKGENISPHLAWKGAPANTKSFAIIMDDPDAPHPRFALFTWVHWVVFNIPADISQMEQGAPDGGKLPNGAFQGKNSYRKNRYMGPDPPLGRHTYRFTVYALDTTLSIEPEKASKKALLKLMEGHILASAGIEGTFAKADAKGK